MRGVISQLLARSKWKRGVRRQRTLTSNVRNLNTYKSAIVITMVSL